MKLAVRIDSSGQKIATLSFGDSTVIDRFVIKAAPDHTQYEVYDNLSGALLYSRAIPHMAAIDVLILNKIATQDNSHEE